MRLVEGGVAVPFALSLFFWLRGVWKRSAGDMVASGVLFFGAVCAYVWFIAYCSLSYLPALAMLIFAAASLSPLLKKTVQPGSRRTTVALAASLAVLSMVLFLGEKKWESASNSLLVIQPYKAAGTWVFDEPRLGLYKEPFVSGIPQLIDRLVEDIPDADQGFRLIFSDQPFPSYDTKIIWRREEAGGNWYYSEQYQSEGWLCPALFKFFRRAPREIYVKAETR